MRNIIIANTCDNPARVELWENNQKINLIKWDQKKEKADCLISKIDMLLIKNKLKPENIDFEINEFCQNGSYTGHRIGISVINAINFSLGRKKRFSARYGMVPKITKKIFSS